MPNSTTGSSRPSSEFLDRMLLGARGGILQPEWVFHYFPDWKLSALASEWGIRAQPVTVICFNLHIYYTYTSFDAANPMKPTAFSAPTDTTYDERFYGYENANADFTTYIPTSSGLLYVIASVGTMYPPYKSFCIMSFFLQK